MSANEQEAKSPVSLTAEDLEAALRLLSAEAPAGRTDVSQLILSLLAALSFGIFLLACPGAAVIVWFQPALGKWLGITAGIALLLFAVLAVFTKGLPGSSARSALEGSGLLEAAKTVWEKQSRSLGSSAGCGAAALLGILSLLVGIGWFIGGLFITRQVSTPSLILIAAPFLIFWTEVAISDYREFQYYSQVSKLRSRFESQLQQAGAQGIGEVMVSPEERDLLSRVEIEQTERKVAQAAKGLSEKASGYYSVTIASDVLRFLGELPEEEHAMRWAIREAADSLQMHPHPPDARPLEGAANRFVISSQDYRVVYQVDDDRQRVEIVGIHALDGGEVSHAA